MYIYLFINKPCKPSLLRETERKRGREREIEKEREKERERERGREREREKEKERLRKRKRERERERERTREREREMKRDRDRGRERERIKIVHPKTRTALLPCAGALVLNSQETAARYEIDYTNGLYYSLLKNATKCSMCANRVVK